jgi:hypothetical protein
VGSWPPALRRPDGVFPSIVLRARAAGRSERAEIRAVDVRDLPAEGTSYHRVVSTEILEAAVGYRYLPGTVEMVDGDDPFVLTGSGSRAFGPVPGAPGAA